jgi:hypothetical protein
MSAQDLFTWRDEADAAQRVAEAEEARAAALRKARCAPHGEVQNRRQRLQDATLQALAAEIALQRIQGQPK